MKGSIGNTAAFTIEMLFLIQYSYSLPNMSQGLCEVIENLCPSTPAEAEALLAGTGPAPAGTGRASRSLGPGRPVQRAQGPASAVLQPGSSSGLCSPCPSPLSREHRDGWKGATFTLLCTTRCLSLPHGAYRDPPRGENQVLVPPSQKHRSSLTGTPCDMPSTACAQSMLPWDWPDPTCIQGLGAPSSHACPPWWCPSAYSAAAPGTVH